MKKAYDLTPEQDEAAKSGERKYSVRASAGSGKTSVLVSRYVWFVTHKGISPDEILTITFTRKAASEMKGRIVKKLRDAGFEDEAQVAETGPIQTIHSFCERILRENALFAALDFEFEIMDEAETHALRDEAIRRVIESEVIDDPDVADLVRRLAGHLQWGRPESLDGKIRHTVDEAIGALRGSTWTPQTLRAIYQSPDHLMQAWLTAMTESLPAEFRAWKEGDSPGQAVATMKALLRATGTKKIPKWMGQIAQPEIDNQAISDSLALMKLALAAWEQLDSLMDQAQRFDFPRMERLAVELIRTSPDAQRRVRESYQAALVDEAQDMNPVQYELLDALSIGYEMLVGDPQQSIYGFRMADKDLFVNRTNEGPSLKLKENHRSDPGILAFVDTLFGRLWGADYVPMSQPKETDDLFESAVANDFTGVEFWECQDKQFDFAAQCVRQLIAEGESPKDIAVLVHTGGEANRMSDELTRLGVPNEVVGGRQRFFARLEVRDLANCLEAAIDPYNDLSMLNLLRTPVVDLSLDSIILLASHKPIIESLATFDPPIPEDRQKLDRFLAWFLPLNRVADRVPAWELLSEIFRVSEWLPKIASRPNGVQELANVRKLFALASGRRELHGREFAAEIRQIQSIHHSEGDAPFHDTEASVVRIQTIHKSKGLEYDVVVLPTLLTPPRDRAGDVRVHAKSGLVLFSTTKTRPTLHPWLVDESAQMLSEEGLRVLYVAMTRAKRRLCLSIPDRASNASHGSTIVRTMGYPSVIPPGIKVRKPGSP